MEQAKFSKLSLTGKYRTLKQKGEWVAKRFYGSFEVHLYSFCGYYVEVWCRLGIEGICWIEAPSQQQLEPYLKQIKLELS